MTLSQEVHNAMQMTINSIIEETQYKETENTIAEVKYFEAHVQRILKRYKVDFISEGRSNT